MDCWNTSDPVPNTVNIKYNQTSPTLSYVADLAFRRANDGSIPFSHQAMMVYGHVALLVFLNGDETHNRVVTISLSNKTVLKCYEDILPAGYHWNSAVQIGNVDGAANVLFVAGTAAYVLPFNDLGENVGLGDSLTIDRAIWGIAYDPEHDILYGHHHGVFYRLTFSGTAIFSEQLFDVSVMISTMTEWQYPGFADHQQEIEYHDGILYSLYSFPNTIFRFTPTGTFLGVDSVPYVCDGYPVGEMESIAWSDSTHCFIMSSQGRSIDSRFPVNSGSYSDNWLWGRCFVYAYGGAAAANWLQEYVTNDFQPTNIQTGSVRNIYAAASRPSDTPQTGDSCYHVGSTAYPFNFLRDAIYMAGQIEANSSRLEVNLHVKGDFAAYEIGSEENGITVQYDVRIQLDKTDIDPDTLGNGYYTVLPKMGVVNGASCSFMYGELPGADSPSDYITDHGHLPYKIEALICSKNTISLCEVVCDSVTVNAGAFFTGNYLGTDVALYVKGNGTARLGATGLFISAGNKEANGLIISRDDVITNDSEAFTGLSTGALRFFGGTFTDQVT